MLLEGAIFTLVKVGERDTRVQMLKVAHSISVRILRVDVTLKWLYAASEEFETRTTIFIVIWQL